MATSDFSFSWTGADAPDGPWAHLQVVRFQAREEISTLYRYELTLLAKAPAPEVDPGELVHQRATLRIRTLSAPEHKVVHGVVVEAEEIASLPEGQLYRVVLMPPLVRARYRKRCRIFLEKSTRQIIEAVLTGDPRMMKVNGGTVDEDDGLPSYQPAAEQFTWRMLDTSRLDDKRVRHYCVQYNESDLDFVARLLEEEGISYHFENGAGVCLLVLTDHDGGRARVSPSDVCGPGVLGRQVKGFALGARLRPDGVVFDDYNWTKPQLDMRAKVGGKGLVEYVYPGRFPDSPAKGKPLAQAVLDRHHVEASYAVGDGGLRVLSAGSIFTLQHPDARYEGEHLVTAVELRGEQGGVMSMDPNGMQPEPFEAWFECARRGASGAAEESRFRPARRTPRPRIVGAQTAVVTAEPNASSEVNVGGPDGISLGCVRLKFHWDDDRARHGKEATSCWVRVSQVFAGAGEGAVWHPRVGVEVIVDFEEGDPDRPLVTGRVYNGQNLPPYGGSAVHSTFKSFSTPGGAVWNEYTFNDTAGSELLFLNAGKDHTTTVGNDRLEKVASNTTMTVGANNTETVGANCAVTIGANETVVIGVDQTITVGANSSTTIGGNSDKTVGANETITIGASQTITVGSTLTETVGAAVTESYGATRTTTVTGATTETLAATRTVTVGSNVDQKFGSHSLTVNGSRFAFVGGNMTTKTGGAVTQDYSGSLFTLVGGSQKTVASGDINRNCPFYIVIVPYAQEIDASKFEAKIFNYGITGIGLKVAGISLGAWGAKIDIAGVRASATGVTLHLCPLELYLIGATVMMTSVYICTHGLSLML